MRPGTDCKDIGTLEDTKMTDSFFDSSPHPMGPAEVRRVMTARGLHLSVPLGCEKGSVLILSMIVSMLLVLLGMYSTSRSTIGSRIAANYKLSAQAFYVAQAGIEEARVRLPAICQAGAPTSSWRAFLGTEASAASLFGYDSSDPDQSIVASMQDDMDYTIEIRHKTEADLGSDLDGDGDMTDVVRWGYSDEDAAFVQNTTTGKPIDIITSVGKVSDSSDKIRVEVYRDALDLKYAVFGDKTVDTKNDGTVWKGNEDTPFVASIGSNTSIEIRNKASIYGDVDIGKDADGTQGTYADHGGTIKGNGPNYTDRIDPDPLGLFVENSELDKARTGTITSNSNATGAIPAIAENNIDMGNGGSMTLGGGNYYLTSIRLDNNAILTIDVSSGPVNIYLDGTMETKNSGAINLSPSNSSPGLFTLYCKAVDDSSSASIDIKNGAELDGVIYAPKSNVSLYHGGDIHGMVWGRSVDLKNSGEVLFDPKLKGKFLSPRYTIRYWKEER